jgi:hypothetical protein
MVDLSMIAKPIPTVIGKKTYRLSVGFHKRYLYRSAYSVQGLTIIVVAASGIP